MQLNVDLNEVLRKPRIGGYYFIPRLGAKSRRVKSICADKINARCLLFCRYIEISEALAAYLNEEGFRVIVVHGKLNPDTRQERIHSFKTGAPATLIITRDLGGRGFDLPEADYAVFYSPKEEEPVMWQEILRIRSTRENTKEVFILFYGGTAEEKKYNRLYDDMSIKENYRFVKN